MNRECSEVKASHYAVSWWPLVAIYILAMLLPTCMSYISLRSARASLELLQQSGVATHDMEVKTAMLAAIAVVTSVLFLAITAYLSLVVRRYLVTIDPHGISVRDWRGRMSHAGWGDITEARVSQRGTLMTITHPGGTMNIHNFLADRDKRLLAEQVIRLAELHNAGERRGFGISSIYRKHG